MKEKILSAVVVVFAVAIALNPAETVVSAKQAMQICTNSLVPSLFPFFVCTFLLVELGTISALSKKLSRFMYPLFKVSGAGALPFVMGIVGGYPVGAKICASLTEKGDLTKTEAEKLLAFCNNSGPLFVLGAVGSGMVGNAKIGICLYIAHAAAALTVAFFMRGIKCSVHKSNVQAKQKKVNFGQCLSSCVGDAAENTIKICGYVILFKIITGILEKFIKNKTFMLILYSLLEVSGACASAAENFAHNPYVTCAVISAIIGWSGISVHMQVASAAAQTKLSLKKYFWGKILMTFLSPVYTLLMMPFICPKTDAFSGSSQLLQTYVFGVSMSLVCIGVTVVLITATSAVISRNKFSNNY